MPTKKSKPKKAPAKKPGTAKIVKLRGASLLRSMFAEPGISYTIDELVTAMGNKGKTPRASAAAVMSHLRNPKMTTDLLDIRRNKETGKYGVVTALAGAGSSSKSTPTAVAGANGSTKKKPKAKKATPVPKTGANGPRIAAA